MIDDITEYVYKVQRLKNDFHRQEFYKLLEANSKLDVVQLCETQILKFVLCEAVNINSFSAS